MDSYYRQYIDAADAMRARGEPVPPYREWLEGQLAIVHSLLEDARWETDDRESELAVYRAVHLPSVVNTPSEEEVNQAILDETKRQIEKMLRERKRTTRDTINEIKSLIAEYGDKPLTTSGGGA